MSANTIPELAAMDAIAKIMLPLTQSETDRIITWLIDYFDYGTDEVVAVLEQPMPVAEDAAPSAEEASATPAYQDGPAVVEESDEYPLEDEVAYVKVVEAAEQPAEELPEPTETFASLYEAVAPKTAAQKAVTAAYWLETKQDKPSWRVYDISALLKTIGVKVNALSNALSNAVKKDEPLVELLAKSGDSMQARKTFQLADAGYAFVEDRLDAIAQ